MKYVNILNIYNEYQWRVMKIIDKLMYTNHDVVHKSEVDHSPLRRLAPLYCRKWAWRILQH